MDISLFLLETELHPEDPHAVVIERHPRPLNFNTNTCTTLTTQVKIY